MEERTDMKDVSSIRHNAHIHNAKNFISEQAQVYGFVPAFKDCNDGRVYLSRNANGALASIHKLDGLPKHLLTCLDPDVNERELKKSVIAGFVRDNNYFSRSQAASLVQCDSLVETTYCNYSLKRQTNNP